METQANTPSGQTAAKLPDLQRSLSAAMPLKEKWKGAVTDSSGFVAVPMALLRVQTKLGLTATDMVVLVNLLAHWWDPARAVYPRSTTIAQRMGVTKRTVQRSTQKMINAGLINREFLIDGKRVFQFDPLVARLELEMPSSLLIKVREGWDQ
jgi:Helix-turn-helix domain